MLTRLPEIILRLEQQFEYLAEDSRCLNIASPIGNGYPPIDFESENISGLIPALSNEKNVPVLAQPTCTSSTTIRISFLSQNSRSALRYSTENTFTPPSACTVSIKIAAGFSTPE